MRAGGLGPHRIVTVVELAHRQPGATPATLCTMAHTNNDASVDQVVRDAMHYLTKDPLAMQQEGRTTETRANGQLAVTGKMKCPRTGNLTNIRIYIEDRA